MDSLEYQQSKAFLNATEGAKTGLETSIEKPVEERDGINWSAVTTLLSKGLDLGIGIVNPTAKAETLPPAPKPEETIMGMPKIAVYGGVAVIGLIGLVIVVKKMKK